MTRCSPGIEGLYPVGEGAGYAGGIVSAAVDGLRTAKAIIDRLAADIAKAMKDPGVVDRLRQAGTEAVGSTPQELDTFNRDQLALYRGIVADPRLKLNLQ